MDISRLKKLKRMIDQKKEAFRGVNMTAFVALRDASKLIKEAIAAETSRVANKEKTNIQPTVFSADLVNKLQSDIRNSLKL